MLEKIKLYWKLIKSLQTFLLVLTGLTGFISSRCPYTSWHLTLLMLISLFLAIAGTTVFNMVFDKDIDAKMDRTRNRPLPSGQISTRNAIIFGLILTLLGLSLAFYLSFLYAIVILTGVFIDFVIYTVWLKRISAWSILWGGISGGMPILAGRVLGMGEIDLIGILLAASILFWIPTHIMTFNIRHFEDYNNAEIPTFASKYGFTNTRLVITISAILSSFAFAGGAFILGLEWGFIRVIITLTIINLGFAVNSLLRPNSKTNFRVFKVASLHMIAAMIVIIFGSLYYG